jgi:hypothetical protein
MSFLSHGAHGVECLAPTLHRPPISSHTQQWLQGMDGIPSSSTDCEFFACIKMCCVLYSIQVKDAGALSATAKHAAALTFSEVLAFNSWDLTQSVPLAIRQWVISPSSKVRRIFFRREVPWQLIGHVNDTLQQQKRRRVMRSCDQRGCEINRKFLTSPLATNKVNSAHMQLLSFKVCANPGPHMYMK